MPDDLTYVQIDQIENQHQKYRLVDSAARASLETALTAINNILAGNSTPDTKNTAGATNNTNELYLIGATTQGENPQTYSNSTVYINNNNLYANNSKVLTLNDVNRTGPLNNTNNIVPSQQTVRSYIENQSFLTYKGEVNTQNGLPISNVKIGDTYRVIENGTYAGESCRIGDLIIAIANDPIGWIIVHSSTDPSLFLTNATGGLTVENQTVSHSNTPIIEQTTEAVYPITMDEYGHITSYGQAVDLESLVSIQPGEVDDIREISYADPSAGYEDKYARVDHVHTITDNTITSALGYTPYDSSNPQGYTHIEGVRIGDNIATVSGGQIDITDYISAASAGISAGSGLTSSTSGSIVTLNHSNSTTPKATQAVYPITIDSQGHIVSSGTAVDLSNLGPSFRYAQVGGTRVEADSASGTLTFAAGANVSLTANATTDTITISSTGSGGITNVGIDYTDEESDNIGELVLTTTDAGGGGSGGSGTDENVLQQNATDNANYRILLSKSASDNQQTGVVKKNTNLFYNTSSNTLTLNGSIFLNNPSGSEVIRIRPTNNQYAFETGNRYLWFRKSNTANTLPDSTNTSQSSVLYSTYLIIGNAFSYSSSTPFTQKMTLGKTSLTFSTRTDGSDSETQQNYVVNATKITNWDNAVTTANSVKSKTDVLGNTVINNKTVSSFTSGTSMKNIASFSLVAGTWIVTAAVRFAADSTGIRAMCLSSTSTGDGLDPTCIDNGAASTGGKFTLRKITTILIPTSTTTYYINGYQSSGSSLSTVAQWKCVRIK